MRKRWIDEQSRGSRHDLTVDQAPGFINRSMYSRLCWRETSAGGGGLIFLLAIDEWSGVGLNGRHAGV